MDLLRSIDNDFGYSLETRVDIESYVQKFITKGVCFGYIDGDSGSLLGILGAYCNDYANKYAYITILGVVKSCRGKGIAKSICKYFFEYLNEKAFKIVEVETNNEPAKQLYLDLGFNVTASSPNDYEGTKYSMKKIL
ncbi:MAG: GNAT family N-acetyltransferase [bacterium]